LVGWWSFIVKNTQFNSFRICAPKPIKPGFFVDAALSHPIFLKRNPS
jgi:hypothetical protein